MIVKLLTEHHFKYLSLKGGCTGSSQSTHVKMPHCWKSHAKAKIIKLYGLTDGRVVCKTVFSITFNVSFCCSKQPSHREDSFEHQTCLSENIKVDLRIISKLTSKLDIKSGPVLPRQRNAI